MPADVRESALVAESGLSDGVLPFPYVRVQMHAVGDHRDPTAGARRGEVLRIPFSRTSENSVKAKFDERRNSPEVDQ
jgi:hypothetical protein